MRRINIYQRIPTTALFSFFTAFFFFRQLFKGKIVEVKKKAKEEISNFSNDKAQVRLEY